MKEWRGYYSIWNIMQIKLIKMMVEYKVEWNFVFFVNIFLIKLKKKDLHYVAEVCGRLLEMYL